MIAEGSSKLASVPSGGSGGGAAVAGGAAASGGAAAEEAKEEEKEEGMWFWRQRSLEYSANTLYREGGVRRRYGFRSFRLKNQPLSQTNPALGLLKINAQGYWKGLCGLCLSFAYHESKGLGFTNLLMTRCSYAYCVAQ